MSIHASPIKKTQRKSYTCSLEVYSDTYTCYMQPSIIS